MRFEAVHSDSGLRSFTVTIVLKELADVMLRPSNRQFIAIWITFTAAPNKLSTEFLLSIV